MNSVFGVFIIESNAYPGHTQPSQVTYASKPSGHGYQASAGVYSEGKSPGKNYPASQSAFTSYPSHYAHQQQKQLQESYTGYPRMQQPSSMCSFVANYTVC